MLPSNMKSEKNPGKAIPGDGGLSLARMVN
jgi:hypothetical protein